MQNISRRGFTLIELLVVISIIAILASLVAAGLGVAQKRARQAGAENKAHNMSMGVLSLLQKRNMSKRPLMEIIKAQFSGITDRFLLAQKIKIDWEMNPLQPQWFKLMNPADKENPYFPRLNARLKMGGDVSKRIDYEYTTFVDFNDREIKDSPVDSKPHCLDPWLVGEYIYTCYYKSVSGSGDTYLVDGILSKGPDGLYDEPGASAIDETAWMPDLETIDENKDNIWVEIGHYKRTP